MHNLTYLGPSKQMRAGGRFWEVGVAHQLPLTIAEKFMRRYPLAEWSLEVIEEPEVKETVKRTRRTRLEEPEPETEEPESGSEDPTSEPVHEGFGEALNEEE